MPSPATPVIPPLPSLPLLPVPPPSPLSPPLPDFMEQFNALNKKITASHTALDSSITAMERRLGFPHTKSRSIADAATARRRIATAAMERRRAAKRRQATAKDKENE